MTSYEEQEAQRFRVKVFKGNETLSRYLPGLGWLDFNAGDGADHVGLPSDLYIVSVPCEETPNQSAEAALQVVISPVRLHARRFTVQGRSQVAVASLTPYGMHAAFGAVPAACMDSPVPLDHLCGRSQERRLAYAMHSARSIPQKIEAFGRWLEERITQGHGLSPNASRAARAAMVYMQPPRTHLGVGDIADMFAVTRRQLERDFHANLGVSPASYGRLVRFQRAAAAVSSGVPLLHAAFDHGFADQSHMNRAFKEFAMITPGELARDGARAARQLVRAGMGGRVFLLDVQNREESAANSGRSELLAA